MAEVVRGRSPTPRELGGSEGLATTWPAPQQQKQQQLPHLLKQDHGQSQRQLELELLELRQQLHCKKVLAVQECILPAPKAVECSEATDLWEAVRGLHEEMAQLRQEQSQQAERALMAEALGDPGCTGSSPSKAAESTRSDAEARENIALEVNGLRRELSRARQDLAAALEFVPSKDALTEACRWEKQERIAQHADHEARIAMSAALLQKVEEEVSRHEELLERLCQERLDEQATLLQVDQAPAPVLQVPVSPRSDMLESLQQRLREEVAAITQKHQSQFSELKELITSVFAQTSHPCDLFEERWATAADTFATKEDVHVLVRTQVQQAVERQLHSLEASRYEVTTVADTLASSPSWPAQACGSSQVVGPPPADVLPCFGGAEALGPDSPCAGGGGGPRWDGRQQAPDTRTPSPQAFAPAEPAEACDAAADAIGSATCSEASTSTNLPFPLIEQIGVSTTSSCGRSSPGFPRPQSPPQFSPGRSGASPVRHGSTGAAICAQLTLAPPMYAVGATSSTCGTPRACSLGRSWPATPAGNMNITAGQQRIAATVSAASVAGAAAIASVRMATYAQRRRLATSRGAPAPVIGPLTTLPAPQPPTSARGPISVRLDMRPKSHEQRCVRTRLQR